jgi:uroporphyrin-III C-methyltransferase
MTVFLVGAGPGDPELLTVKAHRLIREAEVIVHDALVDESILHLAPADVELIDVGKRPGNSVPQELINTLLVHLGSSESRVVRLKGGDPFVFGRGGEEAAALQQAGVDFEIVPGVSSAVGVPAVAGIPVTHRGVSGGFAVVTGHREVGSTSHVNWHALAQSGITIVVLMGVAERAVISAKLLAGGMRPDTPVAAIRFGTRLDESVIRTTLDELPKVKVESPSTIVIGDVAQFEFKRTKNSVTNNSQAGELV